jgi:outer membrane lipase/esterase
LNTRKWARALLAAATAFTTAAHADYSKLVVFGDSMSDSHRMYEISKVLFGKPFPAPPNYPGRVCDGPVAVEYLADNLKLPLHNYAFDGATSGYDSLLLIPLGVLTQVNEYLNNNAVVPTITTIPILSTLTSKLPGTGRADPKALHMIWAGPDDYYRFNIGMNSVTTVTTVANIEQAITSLYNGGARYFFVPLMPDLSLTPSAVIHEKFTPGYVEASRKMSDEFAVELTKLLAKLRTRYPSITIMTYDTIGFQRVQFPAVKAQGKNLDVACRQGGIDLATLKNTPLVGCADPENYVFWDGNHPTSWVNKILAGEWTTAITVKP